VTREKPKKRPGEVIPLFGRDEMNMVEFPFGPITPDAQKTFVVDHPFYARKLKKEVSRRLLITGSDAFGLPRPVDDQVLMAMKAMTYDAKFRSPTVTFTRYQLCRILGWPVDGRSYRRIEDSLDRIAGTTLKFQDSWWDKGDELWTSQTFHLIDNVSIATRTQRDRARLSGKNAAHQLCSFTWNDVIWKSFQDGYIKKIDMEMYRRIARGRRREVALRLYRVLDKRMYRKGYAKFDIRKLGVGILGLSDSYCPSEMVRVLKRAADWLIECGYLREMRVSRDENNRSRDVVFIKASRVERQDRKPAQKRQAKSETEDRLLLWYRKQSKGRQDAIFKSALSYAAKKDRNLYEGYERNRGASAEAEKSYRDMIITRYLKARLRKKAESKAA